MMKYTDNRNNNSAFDTRTDSQLEYNYPNVGIINLKSFDGPIENDRKSEAPKANKNAIIASSQLHQDTVC